MPTFPVVPNPYTVLSTIPLTATHFTVLDLKDAFFTIPLHPLSQSLFAFTWQDPETHVSQQLTWTVLPQGFRDSPHFFGQALQKDLQTLDLSLGHLLQSIYILDVRIGIAQEVASLHKGHGCCRSPPTKSK